MARYAIGDKIILTRKESVEHFRVGNMSIRGEIVEIKDKAPYDYDNKQRRYGIKFTDRPWVDFYAAWEFKRTKGD